MYWREKVEEKYFEGLGISCKHKFVYGVFLKIVGKFFFVKQNELL